MSDSASKPLWWVYIIQTQKQRFYTGITTDVERRFRQHQGQLKGGAKYFNSDKAEKVVYRESWPDRSSASSREAQIKALSHQEKCSLVNSFA